MPTYEYRCSHCGAEWEREHKITEDPKRCDLCERDTAVRLISSNGGNRSGVIWKTPGDSAAARQLTKY